MLSVTTRFWCHHSCCRICPATSI